MCLFSALVRPTDLSVSRSEPWACNVLQDGTAEDVAEALLFLANHAEAQGRRADAEHLATRVLELPWPAETREARAILRRLHARAPAPEAPSSASSSSSTTGSAVLGGAGVGDPRGGSDRGAPSARAPHGASAEPPVPPPGSERSAQRGRQTRRGVVEEVVEVDDEEEVEEEGAGDAADGSEMEFSR